MPKFDFKCKSGHIIEKEYGIFEDKPDEIPCKSNCPYYAKRKFGFGGFKI